MAVLNRILATHLSGTCQGWLSPWTRPLLLSLTLASATGWAADEISPTATTQVTPSAPATPGQISLSLEEAVALALGQSAALKQAEAQVQAARAGLRDAAGVENLELRLSPLGLSSLQEPAPTYELGVRFRPPQPLALSGQRAVARAEEKAARGEEALAREALILEVRRRFEEAWLLQEELEATRASVEARARLRTLASERLQHGMATRMDVTLAELSESEGQRAILEAEAAYERALGGLRARLKMPAEQGLVLRSDPLNISSIKVIPSDERLVQHAIEAHPNLRIAQAGLEEAKGARRAARAALVPWFSFVHLGYTLAPIATTPVNPWSLGAGVEIPLPGLNQSGSREARAQVSVAQRQLEADREAVVLAVREASLAVRQAERVIRGYEGGPVQAAGRAESEVKRALEAGQVALTEAALVAERCAEVRVKRASLWRAYLEAYENLREAVGGELPSP